MKELWLKIPLERRRILVAFLVLCSISAAVKYFAPSNDKKIQAKSPEDHSKLLSKYTFAGEVLPFDSPPIWKRYRAEINKNKIPSQVNLHMIKASRRWFPLIEPILKRYGIPKDFKYIAAGESKFVQAKSAKGAGGFWQMMPSTARELGLEVNEEVDERYNVMKSTEVACRFFKQNYKIFGDWTSVVIAYNIGTYGLLKLKKFQKMDNAHFLKSNRETERYFFLVMACKDLIEHPSNYGYRIRKSRPVSQVKTLTVNKSITDLQQFCKQHNIDLATLKSYNPWIRSSKLTIKKETRNKSYALILPIRPMDFSEGLSEDNSSENIPVGDTAIAP